MEQLHRAISAAGLIRLLDHYGCGLYPSRIKHISAQDLQPVIDTFIEMTALPEKERREWVIDVDGSRDDGLFERKGKEEGNQKDNKFFFHYKDMARIMNAMQEKEVYLSDKKKWDYFLHELKRIHDLLCQDMYDIVVAFDQKYPQYGALEKLHRQPPHLRGVLRLLYYKPGFSVTARPHYDQSFLTCHVADSNPGLIFGKDNTDVYRPEDIGNVLVFPGFKAEVIASPILSATMHSAIADEVTIKQGRWSMVFFYHCAIDMPLEEFGAILDKKIKEIQ